MPTPMPNRTNIRKWVRALRSGKYRKGMGMLRDGTRYCCLGVACDISKLGVWQDDSYSGESHMLPKVVQGWLGLPDDGDTWANRNDGSSTPQPWSFRRIAAALEKQYLTPRPRKAQTR